MSFSKKIKKISKEATKRSEKYLKRYGWIKYTGIIIGIIFISLVFTSIPILFLNYLGMPWFLSKICGYFYYLIIANLLFFKVVYDFLFVKDKKRKHKRKKSTFFDYFE